MCLVGRYTLLTSLHFSSLLWPPCAADADIIFMVALCNRADHYILPGDFYLLSFFLSSFFPRLISAVGDWMSTILPHGVALVRI